MVFHDSACEPSPSEGNAIQTDEIPSFLSFKWKGLAFNKAAGACKLLRVAAVQPTYISGILWLQKERERMGWLKPPFLDRAKMQAGSEYLEAGQGGRMLRKQIELFAKGCQGAIQ